MVFLPMSLVIQINQIPVIQVFPKRGMNHLYRGNHRLRVHFQIRLLKNLEVLCFDQFTVNDEENVTSLIMTNNRCSPCTSGQFI